MKCWGESHHTQGLCESQKMQHTSRKRWEIYDWNYLLGGSATGRPGNWHIWNQGCFVAEYKLVGICFSLSEGFGYYFLVTFSGAQYLLLILYSGITLGNSQGTVWGAGDQTWVCCGQNRCPKRCTIILAPLVSEVPFWSSVSYYFCVYTYIYIYVNHRSTSQCIFRFQVQ